LIKGPQVWEKTPKNDITTPPWKINFRVLFALVRENNTSHDSEMALVCVAKLQQKLVCKDWVILLTFASDHNVTFFMKVLT
jgi:hypothetical protein